MGTSEPPSTLPPGGSRRGPTSSVRRTLGKSPADLQRKHGNHGLSAGARGAALQAEPAPRPPSTARTATTRTSSIGDEELQRGRPWTLSVYTSTDPLSRYTALQRLSPSTYEALAATARRKTLRLDAETEPLGAAASPGAGTIEAFVPTKSLVWPSIPSATHGDLRSRLWPLVAEQESNEDAIAQELLDELSGRWSQRNLDLLEAPVRIRLLEPEEIPLPTMQLGEAGATEFEEPLVLAFDIEGEPVSSEDGSLQLLELDLIGSNSLEQQAAELVAEAGTIAQAGDLLRTSMAVLSTETEFWDRVRNRPESIAANDVDAHYGLVELQMLDAGPLEPTLLMAVHTFLDRHPEFQAELGDAVRRLSTLQVTAWEAYSLYRRYYSAELASPDISTTMREGVDNTWTRAREMRERGTLEGGLGYAVAGLSEALFFLMNTGSAGYLEARHEGVLAFRSGKISSRQLDDLADAAAGRGAAVGLVSLALIAVTAGIAGPVLGASATIGRQIAFNAVAGGVSGVIAAGATSAISRSSEFEDPTLDAIWGRGRLGPGDILASGVFGAALGAASVPVGLAFGKFAAWWKSSPGGPRFGPVEAPPGWVAEQVTEELVRYTKPGLPGEIIVGRGMMRFQMPAGTGMRVVAEVPVAAPQAPRSVVSGAEPIPFGRRALSAGLSGKDTPVWLNPRSRVYHEPGSRWYGKTVGGQFASKESALAQGYRPVGELPPTGVYATERPPLGEPRIVIRSKLGPPMARRGYERQYMSAAEYALDEIAGWERAHSQGAGLRAEAQAAIRLATKQVNQELQRNGVERTMRDLVRKLSPGDELHLTTTTMTHEGTLRLKEIQYQLYLHRAGGAAREAVFEVAIELSLAGRASTSAQPVGILAR